jgi:hypothetical protein
MVTGTEPEIALHEVIVYSLRAEADRDFDFEHRLARSRIGQLLREALSGSLQAEEPSRLA